MTITIPATDVELPLEVNNIYSHTFLDRAIGHLPYLTGSKAGKIEKGKDSRTMKWSRHGEIGEDVTPLGELTGDSVYGQGRNSTQVSRTNITATLAKYGRFLTFNEEVNIFEGSAVINDITGALGEGCGKSLNGLQRNILEDNITLRFASGAANDAAVSAKIVCCSYDATTHICSNGKKQFAGQVPWPSADLLLADKKLSEDVNDYFNSLNIDTEEEYCLMRRKSMLDEYSITDQLDVILKTFNQLRLSGTPLPQDMDDLLGHWTSIKKIHPKPEPKEA